MNSPLRWPGGKHYARNLIQRQFPAHTSYAEVFAGGASVFFAKPRLAAEALNDLDGELINCYRVIRDHAEDLIRLFDGIEISKDWHGWYKNDYRPDGEIERAFRFYYLNRTSYSGIMKPQNCYFGWDPAKSMKPANWGKTVRLASDRLQGVELSGVDFEEALERLPDGTLALVDPPYFDASHSKWYMPPFGPEDHQRLAAALRRNHNRIMFMVTYDNCDAVRALYDWCDVLTDHEWTYCLQRTDDQKGGLQKKDNHKGKRFQGQELFISNFPRVQAA